jgi:aryl-alcohol dehydrogenase-like predicted oxidoreductase
MVRGAPKEREQAVARALDFGINYFDTAPAYADGLSEQHLGDVLRALNASVYIGTKFSLWPDDMGDVRGAVARSLEASLRRLGRESVDLLQLNNQIGRERRGGLVGMKDVLQEVVPAFQALRAQGKVRFIGFTALGDTDALHEVIGDGVFDTAQVCYNLLNPSAGQPIPARFPGQDFGQLLNGCRARGVGVIGIRALAGGALSGVPDRHPIATRTAEPIATGPDYLTDVRRAQRFRILVEEGHAASLVEAALRLAITTDILSTAIERLASVWRELTTDG